MKHTVTSASSVQLGMCTQKSQTAHRIQWLQCQKDHSFMKQMVLRIMTTKAGTGSARVRLTA